MSADIILCKETKQDSKMFNVLLQKMGYSVEVAKDLEEFKAKILNKNFKYALLDKSVPGVYEDNELSQLLKKLSIKSVLFVKDLYLATENDRKKYTSVGINIPNSDLLRSLILKLDSMS